MIEIIECFSVHICLHAADRVQSLENLPKVMKGFKMFSFNYMVCKVDAYTAHNSFQNKALTSYGVRRETYIKWLFRPSSSAFLATLYIIRFFNHLSRMMELDKAYVRPRFQM